MATKKKTNTRDASVVDYAPRTNDAVYLAKAIGEVLTLPETDRTRLQLYLRKLIEVIEQGGGQHLYKHNIYIFYRNYASGTTEARIYFSLYSTRDTRYRFNDLLDVFENEGATSVTTAYTCVTGIATTNGTTTPIYALKCVKESGNIITLGGNISIVASGTDTNDTVTQIL